VTNTFPKVAILSCSGYKGRGPMGTENNSVSSNHRPIDQDCNFSRRNGQVRLFRRLSDEQALQPIRRANFAMDAAQQDLSRFVGACSIVVPDGRFLQPFHYLSRPYSI